MSFMRRCDGCGVVADAKSGSANWLYVGFYDADGDLDKSDIVHACSWNCLVTVSMDAEDLFPDVVPGSVEA